MNKLKQILSDLFKSNRLKREEELVEAYRNRKNELIKEVNNNKKIIDNLNKNNGQLIEENQRLIEWIQNILKVVNTSEINREHINSTITIPVYKKERIYSAVDWTKPQKREEIFIPSIRIVREVF